MKKSNLLLTLLLFVFATHTLNAQCAPAHAGFALIGQLNGHNYYLSDGMLKPVDAAVQAQSMGGYLATIGNLEEDNFIKFATVVASDFVLIGLNDAAAEGSLVWTNGEAVDYTNINPCGFCSGNDTNNDFAVKDPWSGAWSFINYWSQRRYLVEIPCGESNTECSFLQTWADFDAIDPEVLETNEGYQFRILSATNPSITLNERVISVNGDVVSTSTVTVPFSGISGDVIASNNGDYFLIQDQVNNMPNLKKQSFAGDVLWENSYPINLPFAPISIGSHVYEDAEAITVTGLAVKNSFERQAFMMRIDFNGNLLWQKLIPYESYRVQEHTASGYYMSQFGLRNLTKLDDAGNKLWNHYTINPLGTTDTVAIYIGESSDGTGVYYAEHFDFLGEAITIIRLNATTGVVEWERDVETLFGLPTTDLVTLMSQVTTQDNGIGLQIRWSEDYFNGPSGSMYGKIDAAGNLVWAYDMPRSAFAFELLENTNDNGFIFFRNSAFYNSVNSSVWKFTQNGWNAPICGNMAGASEITMSCPDDIFLPTGSTSEVLHWVSPSATTTCTISSNVDIVQTSGLLSGSSIPVGDHVVSYEATDACNNVSTCSFTITIFNVNSGSCNEIAGFTKLGELNGHGYYLSDASVPWGQAKTLAENAGGYLATMNDQAENDFLKSNLGNNLAFIGYNDAATEGTGQWATTESVTLDLSYSNSTENDYAVMNFWAGTWQMVNQWVHKPFIMEMNCGSSVALPDLTVSNLNISAASGQQGDIISVGFDLNNIGADAVSGTYEISLDLFHDGVFTGVIYNVGSLTVSNTPIGTIGMNTSFAVPDIVAGAYSLKVKADLLGVISELNEFNNSDMQPFVINNGTGGTGCAATITGFTKLGEHNGHGYYLSDASTNWNQAKHLAENAGGYLATMNDQAENDFLKSNLGNSMVFIGYNDATTEGIGQWATTEPVTLDLSYSNSTENDYAVMNFWAGTWQMVNEFVAKKFVMEMNCGSPQPTPVLLNTMVLVNTKIHDVYPNPAMDNITLRVISKGEKDATFSIFDARGQRLLSENRFLPQGASEVEFDLTTLPAGMYFVKEIGAMQYHNFVIMK